VHNASNQSKESECLCKCSDSPLSSHMRSYNSGHRTVSSLDPVIGDGQTDSTYLTKCDDRHWAIKIKRTQPQESGGSGMGNRQEFRR
jgi:hypothetical protein